MKTINNENKNNLLQAIKKERNEEIYCITKKIVREYLKNWDILGLSLFFSDIYEDIYHELLLKKIKLEKRTVRMFEALALVKYESITKNQRTLLDKILAE